MIKTNSVNSILRVSFATLAILSSSVSAKMPEFSDIGGRTDREGIEFLKQSGIVNGYADGTFKPEQHITRAEFTKIILETAQIPISDCSKKEVLNISSIFSDVSSENWFAKYVCSAQKSGLINGYKDRTFKPNQEINFVESAKIITLAQNEKFIDLKKIEKKLDDQSLNLHWYNKYITALEEENAINKNELPAKEEAFTRGQMADVVWRLATGKEIVETTEPLQINSCEQLKKQLEKSQLRNNGVNSFNTFGENTLLRGNIDLAPQTSMMKSSDASDFSTTNIQEFGVDEADIVKNDGSHIFFARGNDVRIVKAYPQNEMKEDAVITVDDMNIQELFLDKNTLVLIGNRNAKHLEIMYQKKMIAPGEYYPNQYKNFTEVRVFDISDRTHPVQTRKVSVEGNIVSSRKINDIVYLITNNYLYNYSTKNPLPEFSDNGAISRITKCDQISYFPNFTSQNLTTISAINVKNTEEKVSFKNILGAGNNIYSSAKNLYVIQSDSKQKFVTDQDDEGNTDAFWDWENISRISKFSLDKTNVEFVAQGEINGGVLNKYSMSEFDNHFRIATHTNGENIVSILNENLEKTGEITGIAKGEQIKSVRFMGKRGFVVTFRNTDPLFVLDLDTKNPKITGELKIPGWSDYLHPIDENYLIGFGKEVSEEAENSERFTWDMQKGMKLSIFDVSDIANPKEIHKTVIGDRGTESEILRNPKALFFDKERKLLGFPIRIMQIENKTEREDLYKKCQETGDREYCVTQYRWKQPKNVFTGAQLYSFDINSGFKLLGAVSHFPEYKTDYWDNSYIIKRLIRIGENMYSISNDMIKGLDMNLKKDTSKEVLFVKAGKCSEIQDVSSCMNRSDCEPLFAPNPECNSGVICTQEAVFDSCGDI